MIQACRAKRTDGSPKKEDQVQDAIKVGNILIKDGTLLPTSLHIESEPCVPGWKLVTQLDGYELGRVVEKAGWAFFYNAAEVKAGAFGTNGPKMARRAIARILKNPKLERFNCLEISKGSSLGSVRFPGIWYVTVSAHARHIQQDLFLFRAQDSLGHEPAKNKISGERTELASSETPALSF
jgi:hypothetical protein